MKIQSFALSEIVYTTCAYDNSLYESLRRIGQTFPIKVHIDAQGILHCIDGHKRCSALADLLIKDPTSKRKHVQVIITNIARTSSGTTMNHH